jgi:heat shock protein HslJ
MQRLPLTLCALSFSLTLAFGQSLPHGLENRRWHIAEYRSTGNSKGDQQRLIEAAKTAEVTFAKGHLSGTPTCGALVGTYELSGYQLSVHADFILNGFCSPEQLLQNQEVLSALKGSLRVEEKDDRIALRDRDGQLRLMLVSY